MTKTDLLPLAREAMEALGEHYRPAMRQVYDEAEVQPIDEGVLFLLSATDPRPETSAYLQQLYTYTSLPALEARMAGAASRGLIEALPDRTYRLTDKGHQVFRRALAAAWSRMAELEPLPKGDMERLTYLLKRLVMTTSAAPEPREKRYLIASRRLDPGEDAPIVARIDQYLTDLIMFRDDVHPAAWRRYNVNGPTWEVFTLIRNGEAHTLEELSQRLERRGHPPDLIPQSFQDLVARGWIAKENGGYRATDEGSRLRQEAEDETDRLFYAPWSCLSEAETAELRDLLMRLREGSLVARELNNGKEADDELLD